MLADWLVCLQTNWNVIHTKSSRFIGKQERDRRKSASLLCGDSISMPAIFFSWVNTFVCFHLDGWRALSIQSHGGQGQRCAFTTLEEYRDTLCIRCNSHAWSLQNESIHACLPDRLLSDRSFCFRRLSRQGNVVIFGSTPDQNHSHTNHRITSTSFRLVCVVFVAFVGQKRKSKFTPRYESSV